METEKRNIRVIAKDFRDTCIKKNLTSILNLKLRVGEDIMGGKGILRIEESDLYGGQSLIVKYFHGRDNPLTVELNNHAANYTIFIVRANYIIPGYNPLAMKIQKDGIRYIQSRTIQNSTDFATCLKELKRLHQISK